MHQISMRHLFLTLAFSMVLAPSAYSQRTIHYRLTMFGAAKTTSKSYVNVPESQTVVRSIRGYVADPVRAVLREDLYLDFFEASRKQEGEQPLKPDFTIEVPTSAGSDLLILLLQNGEDLRPRFLDLTKLKMADGDQILFNTLSVPVALIYSDGSGDKWGKPIKVEPMSNRRIPAPNEFSVGRRVAAENSKTKKFVIFDKGIYIKPVGGREIMFCYLEEGAEKPSLETLLIHDVKRKNP